MRALPGAAAALLVLVVLALPLRADEPARTAHPEPAEKTEVEGSIPADLPGRWMIVSHVKLVSGALTPYARLLEIRAGSGHPDVVLRRAELPQSVTKKIQDAATAGQPWVPTADDLHLLAQGWDGLTALGAEYASIESKLVGADAYPQEFQADDTTKGSRFAIVIREGFSGTQPLRSTYSVFGVRARPDSRLAGTFTTTSIAAAPLPIPITLKGEFQAYRVADTPARPLLQRVLDVFAGCRRT